MIFSGIFSGLWNARDVLASRGYSPRADASAFLVPSYHLPRTGRISAFSAISALQPICLTMGSVRVVPTRFEPRRSRHLLLKGLVHFG